jgi:hypothetical protein
MCVLGWPVCSGRCVCLPHPSGYLAQPLATNQNLTDTYYPSLLGVCWSVRCVRVVCVCELCILLVCVISGCYAARRVCCVLAVAAGLSQLRCRCGVHCRLPALASQAVAALSCRVAAALLLACLLVVYVMAVGGVLMHAGLLRTARRCPWQHPSHVTAALRACAISHTAGQASVLSGSSFVRLQVCRWPVLLA